ncbi:hypothetical protein CDAR_497401 [Caerostris darwini]|uniref:Uncharacterized protein n=1 Tax=Caerostris darwini TaxID=1538125 RepID=A0AAV4S324_9ARAC|nr:hypothetical protein CDAR_497401 [Caerostris darwini]
MQISRPSIKASSRDGDVETKQKKKPLFPEYSVRERSFSTSAIIANRKRSWNWGGGGEKKKGISPCSRWPASCGHKTKTVKIYSPALKGPGAVNRHNCRRSKIPGRPPNGPSAAQGPPRANSTLDFMSILGKEVST